MLATTHDGRSRNGKVAAQGDNREAIGNPRKKLTVYPWISEAFTIVQPLLPCTKNEAIAKIVEMYPQRAVDAALRSRSTSRFSAANAAIRHMIGVRLTIDGDILSENKCRGMSLGRTLLKRLKELSTIHALDTGFTKSSMKTYRPILKAAGWIEVVGSTWIWTGPDDADWSTVTRTHRPKL